jgi:hypothetical protein
MSTRLTHWEKKRRAPDAWTIESPLLSVPEAIKYLKISQSTLYLLMSRLEIVKLNRRIFITRKSADAYINANTRKPTQPAERSRKRRQAENAAGAP